MLYGQEHVDRYVATDGEEGHDWNGTTALILWTKGRRTGQSRPAPLIYQPYGDDLLVVASKGGAEEHPAWYLNLDADPDTEVQVKADRFRAHGYGRGATRHVAHDDRGLARLRRVPEEDRPRDPRGRARAPVGLRPLSRA